MAPSKYGKVSIMPFELDTLDKNKQVRNVIDMFLISIKWETCLNKKTRYLRSHLLKLCGCWHRCYLARRSYRD